MNTFEPQAESGEVSASSGTTSVADWRPIRRTPRPVPWPEIRFSALAVLGMAGFLATPWPVAPLGVAGIALAWALRLTRAKRAQKEDADPEGLAPDPLPPNHWMVALEFRHGGTLIARDRGVLAFVDGWILFEGQRSTFSVTRRHIDLSLRPMERSPVALELPGDRRIAVEFLGPPSGPSPADLVRTWESLKPPEGEPSWPPLTVQPERYRETRRDLLVTLAVQAMILAAVVNGFLTVQEGDAARQGDLLMTVLICIGMLLATLLSIGEYRAVRRIRPISPGRPSESP